MDVAELSSVLSRLSGKRIFLAGEDFLHVDALNEWVRRVAGREFDTRTVSHVAVNLFGASIEGYDAVILFDTPDQVSEADINAFINMYLRLPSDTRPIVVVYGWPEAMDPSVKRAIGCGLFLGPVVRDGEVAPVIGVLTEVADALVLKGQGIDPQSL